jgi:2-alkenal reductase
MIAFGAVAALIGGVAGGGMVALLDGGGGDPGPQSDGGARARAETVSVEFTSALTEAAATGRKAVVRIEATRRENGQTVTDAGSGVIIDDDGHIVTNAHVVLGTETLRVFLPNGAETPAILVGHDAPFTDLAVLRVPPVAGARIDAGDSSTLKVGETVVAVGNPLIEFSGTVTAGIVSGLNRRRVIDGSRYDDLIQIDAPINSGNSGGALVNLRGQFVGMPTLVVRQTRNAQPVEGIGFAIPSGRVMEIASGIIRAQGPYPRPDLGFDALDIQPETQRFTGRLPLDKGAVVTSVAQGGPAASAGVREGDIVTHIGANEINRDLPFINAVMAYSPGDVVKVVLSRAGRIIEVDVRTRQRS